MNFVLEASAPRAAEGHRGAKSVAVNAAQPLAKLYRRPLAASLQGRRTRKMIVSGIATGESWLPIVDVRTTKSAHCIRALATGWLRLRFFPGATVTKSKARHRDFSLLLYLLLLLSIRGKSSSTGTRRGLRKRPSLVTDGNKHSHGSGHTGGPEDRSSCTTRKFPGIFF